MAEKTKTKKKKTVRVTPHVRLGAKLAEPSWTDWEKMSGEEYHKYRENTKKHYYENYKPADLFPAVWQWMKENDYSRDEIAQAKAANQYTVGVPAAILAKMLLNGMPSFNSKEAEYWESLPGTTGELKPATLYLERQIEKGIQEGKFSPKYLEKVEESKQENTNVAPTIQDRIHEQALGMSVDIDDWLETFIETPSTFNPKGFDFKKHFEKQGVTQAHARKIKSFYEKELDDFKDLERMPSNAQLKNLTEEEADWWLQLKEGYNHLKKQDVKNYISAIETLLRALDFVIEASKAQRKPRKPKPKSASKLVEKLKYAKAHGSYEVASINPEQIIGANELWVFNFKTRKLGKYVAQNIDTTGQGRDGSGLSVKGTTIIGFDEEKSIQKTLRKPLDQLKEFKDAGKVKLRKFLDEIPTTDTKLTGRCNLETVLLKVN